MVFRSNWTRLLCHPGSSTFAQQQNLSPFLSHLTEVIWGQAMNFIKSKEEGLRINCKTKLFTLFFCSKVFSVFSLSSLFPPLTQMQSLTSEPSSLLCYFHQIAAHWGTSSTGWIFHQLKFNHRLAGTIYSFSGINNEFRLRANEHVYTPSKDF